MGSLIGFIPAFFCAFVLAYSWMGYYRKLRRRGYGGVQATLGIVVCLIAGVVGAVLALLFLYRRHFFAKLAFTSWLDAKWSMAATGAVCFISVWLVAIRLLSAILPPRISRDRGGYRRGWYSLSGAFFSVAVLLVLAGAFEVYIGSPLAIAGIFVFILAPAYVLLGFRFRKRAAASREMEATLHADERPPVLFVRAFSDEAREFDWVDPRRTGYRAYLTLPEITSASKLTLEVFLGAAVERILGPFVALGNPADAFAPLGAARSYLTGTTWKQEFERLARTCKAVLVQPGTSHELDWEMRALLENGQASKLFLMFGCAPYGRPPGWPDRLADRFFHILPKCLVWEEYRAALAVLGYTLPAEAPPPRTVMGFSLQGSGRVLTSDCRSSEEYVNAIATHLSSEARELGPGVIVPPPPS